MKNLIPAALLLFLSARAFPQVTLDLRLNAGDEDIYVDNYNPTGNYPNEIDYCSGEWTIGGVQARYHTFFKFDLQSIPAGSVINSAYLSLYYGNPNSFNDTHSSLTNSDESVLQRVLDPWSEATMNWNVQPSVSTMNQVILPASTSPTQDYTNMDVTAMVQTMVDSGNYGFSLRLVNEAPYARLIFASGDHPDSLQHPRLVITYTPPLTCFNQRLAPDGEDATFDDYHPAQNNPNEIEYFCGGWTINATFVRWRNVFKFDLSSIPPNATVQNAALSLYFPVHTNFTGANDTSLTSSDECILQRVVTPWTETTVTWNNQPTPDPTNAVHIGPSTSGYQNFPSIDVTAMVQDMINDPANSYGFMLTQLVEQQYGRMLFASGDSPDDSLRPFLEVCYFTTIGVDEINNESDVALWPNPASGHFNLQWNNEADITAVNVFDSMGKLIRNIPKVNSNILQIDATDWAAGLYFVKLTGKGSVLFRRMMKE